MRLAAATAAGSETPDATRLRTAMSRARTEPARVDVPSERDALADDLDLEAADPAASVAHAGERDGVADEQQPVRAA